MTERLFETLRVYWLVFLSTDWGSVVLRFLWILLWIFNDNDNCNVNDNDNGNGNGGEALWGSTGLLFGNSFYGSRFGGTTVYWAFLLWIEVFVVLQRLRQQRKGSLRLHGSTTWRSFLWKIYGFLLRIYEGYFLRFDSSWGSGGGFTDLQRGSILERRLYGTTTWRFGSVQGYHWWCSGLWRGAEVLSG